MVGKRKLILHSALAFGLVILAAFIMGGVLGYLKATGQDINTGSAALWTVGVFAVVTMAISLWIMLRWMSSIDEAAQEAHKWAWFWGGSGGMAVGGVLVMMASLPQAAAINIPAWYAGRTDPAVYAATGGFAMLTLMMIGYGVAWAWWWLGRR
ncbi:hypothetical protein [Brevundimonas faecalis]|uniref:Uncharacterized protein n=1 Tax=Brevundimonas faecalis TaxID=947378 RepID=A0ABV2R6L1_9CAUL